MIRSMRILLSLALAASATASHDNLRRRNLSLGSHNDQFFTLVSAADFTIMNGVAVREASTEGLRSVGLLDPGDYMAYRVDLPSTAMYKLQLHVASPDGSGSFSVGDMATDEIYDTVDTLPATGDWNEWATVSRNVTLPEGVSVLKVQVIDGGWDLLWLSLEQMDTLPVSLAPSLELSEDSSAVPDPPQQNASSVIPEPLQNTTSVIPDAPEPNTTFTNFTLPPQGVCLESIAATDYISMNGSDLTQTAEFVKMYGGEWAAYTITAPYDGTYMLQMRAMDTQGGGALEVLDMETNQQYAAVENIRDAQMWTNVNVVMDLSAGSHTLQVRIFSGCWNLASLCLQEIESVKSSSGGSSNCGCGGSCGCGGGFTQPVIHIHNYIYGDGGGTAGGGNGSIPIYNDVTYGNGGAATPGGNGGGGNPNSNGGNSNNGGNAVGNNSGGSPTNGGSNTGTGAPPTNGFPSSGSPNSGSNVPPNSGVPDGGSNVPPDSGSPTNPNGGTPNSGPNTPGNSGQPTPGDSGANTPGDSGSNAPPDSGAPTQPNSGVSGPGAPSDTGSNSPPADPALPAQPASEAEPALPAQPAPPADPSSPALPSRPSSPSNPALPSSPSDPALPSLPSDPALPSGGSLPSLPSDPSLPSQPSSPTTESCDVVVPASNYRAMSGTDTEPSTGGGTNVGWFDPGDWLEYDVNLPQAGRYKMSYRIASPGGEGGFQMASTTGQVYGTVNSMRASGGWQDWYTDQIDVTLPAGQQTLRINVSEGGWNLAWLCFTA